MATEPDNPTMESTEAEDNNFLIRKKMVDMEAYGLNLIGGWSVKNQKLLGDFMANHMHEMILDANELQYSWQKKSALKDLDMKNRALKDFVQIAYTAGYLRGATSFCEWNRRIGELGSLIGGYYKYVYPDLAENKPKEPRKKK